MIETACSDVISKGRNYIMRLLYKDSKVLVVDCMSDNRRFVKSLLIREGIDKVTAVGTYEEAEEYLKKNKDVKSVITGYFLDEQTGIDIYNLLSEEIKKNFIMIYTEDESSMVFQSVKNYSGMKTLKRPFTAMEFYNAISNEQANKKSPAKSSSQITKKSKILIVDDFEMMRVMMKNAFMELGYQNLEEAGDGEEALEKLLEAKKLNEPFELIFSDWNMPEMDGLELFRCCRSDEQFKEIPFVMVTAENEKSNVIKAITEGVSNYIVKPLTPETLMEKIEKVNAKVQGDRS